MNEEQIRADERQAMAKWLYARAEDFLRINRWNYNIDPDSPANLERIHYAHEARAIATYLTSETSREA